MVIAIDGPAGAGKSTVCRLLAEKLGYTYLDTGAMYRAVAWALMRENIDLELESLIAERLPELPLRFSLESGALSVSYNGSKLREELRRPEMARKSSRVSRFGCVREFLTMRQRKLATEGDIVAEGRDMTTVVFPDAPVKVFLTADLSTRTRRRRAEYLERGIEFDFETLEAQMRERDEADRERSLAPLRPAPDAQIVDTSDLGIAEVVDLLLKLVWEKRPKVDCADSHKN